MQKKHPVKLHLTKQERVDLIRFLLRPCQHRGKLHRPKEKYVTEPDGLLQLAQDVAHWLGHRSLEISVDSSGPVQHGWHAALTNRGALLTIDASIASKQPFIAAYSIVLAVLQVIVWRYGHTRLNKAANRKLLDHMSIEAGLGLYGMNAAHQPTLQHLHREETASTPHLFSVPVATYQHWFISYTKQHNFRVESFEDDLLPAALKSLEQPPLHHKSSNPLIAHTAEQLHHRQQRRILLTLLAVFVLLLGWIAWQTAPKSLSPEEQRKLEIVTELEEAYQICQSELEALVTSAPEPDISASRSIKNKMQSCEQLRKQHNQLVRDLRHR